MVSARFVVMSAALAGFVVMTGGSEHEDLSGPGIVRAASSATGPLNTAVLLPGPARQPVAPAEIATTDPAVVIRGARLVSDVVAVPDWSLITLAVENADPWRSHSLRLLIPGRDPVASFDRPGRQEVRFRSPGPGLYRMSCDIHRRMRGTLHVIG